MMLLIQGSPTQQFPLNLGEAQRQFLEVKLEEFAYKSIVCAGTVSWVLLNESVLVETQANRLKHRCLVNELKRLLVGI